VVQLLIKKDAEKFKTNMGKLIATNNYWSTSINREYARTFAKKPRFPRNTLPVLFEIECHLKKTGSFDYRC
jgi:hypothetical protein